MCSLDDAPAIIRLREGCDRLQAERPIRVGVAIPLNRPVTDGLPHPEEGEELIDIEDRLDEALDGRAELVCVITTGVMREFVLYCASGDWIAEFHTALAGAVTTHEVQVVAATDPDWSTYRAFVEMLD